MQMTITYPGGHQEIEYVDHADPGGVFGPILRRRREERTRKAQAQRDSRLLQLSRDIEALEAWHHAWRLEWDVDYREMHPGQWCERHGKLLKSCYCNSHYRRFTERPYTEPYEIRTGDGTIIRRRPVQHVASVLTTEERRAATRTMAKWGSDR
ncbi:hypothetical protein [Streptomyces sp. SID2119]|uniref:hypothetical protein n=1 Tax=Streptomyces sp. SID2119 TaxID=2690253 RepID=UPI0013709651|nr:hypothetical protein [Streptomyces sp. SID2119]MYW29691.1 hypothetical protein [Streptomyces sp. SID2119]